MSASFKNLPIKKLAYESYQFTKILGWSSSRYEMFDKCKRQYFYNYYSQYVPDIPAYKIKLLKSMTSIALEIGNTIHDVMETLLRRLQKNDSSLDEKKFFTYARNKAQQYCTSKTFLELYYKQMSVLPLELIYKKIDLCLSNFINSPEYSWLIMSALSNKDNWMIEPEGYGETRLNGLKAYCKMDFLFPVDNYIYILDWKTGKKDQCKHGNQLVAYAAAAANNFRIPWERIFPKIIYLYPQFNTFEVQLSQQIIDQFFITVSQQSEQMLAFCADKTQNIPLSIDLFPIQPNPSICRFCNFQQLCFTDQKYPDTKKASYDLDHDM